MRIVLIGMRGSGKSTIGKILARKLNWKYIETDRLIEKKESQKISRLVEKYGWERFRELETEVIQSLGNTERSVIASGGGVILNEENMKILKNNSITIWLQANILTLIERCGMDKNRPFLTDGKTIEDDLKTTLIQREVLYRRYADFSVVNEYKTEEQVACEILEHKICCIIGHPVAHSLSPIMHNTAYKALGLNYIFLPFDVTDLKSAVTSIKNLGIVGCAVTVPHKIKVMKYLDKIDETAKKIGAVNTIINLKGTLTGLNTDWSGALDALKEKTELAGKNVALIGAGGAARAIAYGLKQEAAYVTVFNRNKGHGKELVKDLHLDSYIPLKESTKLDGFDIVINAISVGLESRQSPLTKKSLNQKQVVFDIVYFPRMTRFLKAAKEVGCSIITGDRMLLHCVKRQFELFTGKRIPVEILEDAIC